MAYDEMLAERIRDALPPASEMVEKKMFGGIGFLLNGNMACGVNKDDLIVRVGPDLYEQVLQRPHAKVFDLTGRPMKGWITVGPAGYEREQDLQAWVQLGIDFARTLPPK